MGVDSVLLQQLFMGPPLGDPILCYDNDLVGISNRGESMGNRDGSPPLGELFKALLDPTLTLIVQGAGGLVAEQDRWIFQKHPGDGDP